MYQVRQEAGLVRACCHCEDYLDRFLPQTHCPWSVSVDAQETRNIRLTTLADPYYCLQRPHKVGEDGIDVVQPGEYCNDVGARMRVFLGENLDKENA